MTTQTKNLKISAGKMKVNCRKINVDLIMFTKEIPTYKYQFGNHLLCSLLLKTYLTLSMFLGYVEHSYCNIYRTVSSAIWKIFFEFLIFCNFFHDSKI